jgi:hypothetical protein
MREQNTASEHANALMSRISQPIRARMGSQTRAGLLVLSANFQKVHASDHFKMLLEKTNVRKQKHLQRLAEAEHVDAEMWNSDDGPAWAMMEESADSGSDVSLKSDCDSSSSASASVGSSDSELEGFGTDDDGDGGGDA